MSRADYDALLPVIQAIPDENIKTPGQPVDSYIQEAENLRHWATADQEALEANGLDAIFIEQLPARAGALREAESIWFTTRFTRTEAQRAWKVAEPDGYDLRARLLNAFRYAYRKRPDLLGRVSDIAEGRGHADMIQDLNDIAALGRQNPDLLDAISFNQSQLDLAATRADELANLLAIRDTDASDDPVKKIRDQAYTHLKEAVDEIRACGQYIFDEDSDRFRGYTSAYARQHRGRAEAAETSPAG